MKQNSSNDQQTNLQSVSPISKPSQITSPLVGASLVSVLLGVFAGMVLMSLIAQRSDQTPLEPLTDPLAGVLLQDAVFLSPEDDLQTVVADQPPGTTFVFQPGIYRQQAIIPRDGDRFVGQAGAVLNGALVLETFSADSGRWLSDDPRLADLEPIVGGTCQPEYPRCNYPHDLYLDDQPLQQVTSPDDVGPGTWFFDYDVGRVYLGSDPTGRSVEISTLFFAFSGEADDVLISGLTVEKYGGRGQIGAVWARDGRNWIIDNNVIRLNSAGGVVFGDGARISNNRMMRNGQIGLSGEGDNVRVENNEIAYNNYAGYDAGWEAGGTKFVSTDGLIVRNNYVHHNGGQGLWTDIDNINTLYADNIVVYNDGIGLLHEISFDAIIRDNVVRFNHPMPGSVYSAAQIMVSSSSNVDVTSNDVVMSAAGGNGIVIVQQERGSGQYGPYEARNNRIHDNTVVYLSGAGESGAALSMADADWFWDVSVNRFENNQHIVSDSAEAIFGWENRLRTWDEFVAFGHEANSNLSTQIPASALVVPPWNTD